MTVRGLCFTPGIVAAIDRARTPAGTRFADLVRQRPRAPIAIARADTAL